MNTHADLLPEDLDELVTSIRREHADRLPPAPRQESDDERQLREERTRVVLERDVLRTVQDARRARHQNPLTADDEIEIDMDNLNNVTLRKLQKYVKTALAAPKTAAARSRPAAGGGSSGAAPRKPRGQKVSPPPPADPPGAVRLLYCCLHCCIC